MSTAIAMTQPTEMSVFEPDTMDKLIRFGEFMSKAKSTLPRHLQGNAADCTAVAMQAYRWKMDPFAVAQKTHLVNNVLGYEAQLVVAVINNRAPIVGRLDYEWEGDWTNVNGKTDKAESRACIVSATIVGEPKPRSLRVSMAQVGVRNSPLWVDDPRQQLAYLTAKRWSRLHTPDVILGVYTPDELQEFIPAREPVTATSSSAIIREEEAEDAHVIDDAQQAAQDSAPEFNEENEISMAADEINACETLEELAALELPLGTKFQNYPEALNTVISMWRSRKKKLRDASAKAYAEASGE